MTSQCATCKKNTGIFTCGGCTQAFCTKHANEHRQILGTEMEEIIVKHDQLCQSINENFVDINSCSSLNEINEWERQMIDKICLMASDAREKLKQYVSECNVCIRTAVQQLTERLSKARMEDDFVETDLKQWSDKINQLKIDISAPIPICFETIDDNLIRFVSHPRDYSDLRFIELSKTSESLGFTVTGDRKDNSPIYISRIIRNSVAWKHGLKEGDQLISVNGVSVENEYHEKVANLIRQAQGSV